MKTKQTAINDTELRDFRASLKREAAPAQAQHPILPHSFRKFLEDREGKIVEGMSEQNDSVIYEYEKQLHYLQAHAQRLADALDALFRECEMVHKHWGENCNSVEADAAVNHAREALSEWSKQK